MQALNISNLLEDMACTRDSRSHNKVAEQLANEGTSIPCRVRPSFAQRDLRHCCRFCTEMPAHEELTFQLDLEHPMEKQATLVNEELANQRDDSPRSIPEQQRKPLLVDVP